MTARIGPHQRRGPLGREDGTASKYHTPRFILVPALREELEAFVPADRGPGRTWQPGPALAVVPEPAVR
ncbi:hypothetical protein OG402_41795, partial [Streptomyces anulatus]|nr:hypothetical protein [Streptomyces anulatus]